MISQNLLKSFIFILLAISFAEAFSTAIPREGHVSDLLFTQLIDGQYVPFIASQEKQDLAHEPNGQVVLKQKKESLIGKIRKFFVTPFNFSVPILGNIKKLYYQCEYQVTCAAQEFYEEVIPRSLFISKEQTVVIAHVYFFNIFGRLLTPSGICDALVSRILSSQIPIIAHYYDLSQFAAVCTNQALYSLYTMVTKKVDVAWYLFAFLYHISMRSPVNNYFKINRYAEMIVLGLCAPKMFNYLS